MLACPAHGGDVEVLGSRRERSRVGSTANGAEVYDLRAVVDLVVENLGYSKQVGVRFSVDRWVTWDERPARYVRTFKDGREHWRAEVGLGSVRENAPLAGGRGRLGPEFFQFVAFLRANGAEHWDSNGGRNNALPLCAPLAEPLPETPVAPRPVLAENALYLVERESILRFEVGSGAWQNAAPLPSSRSSFEGCEVVALRDGLFVLGGSSGGSFPRTAHFFDPQSGGWHPLPDLPAELVGRRGISHGNEVHLVPTGSSLARGAETILIFDTTRGTWREETLRNHGLLSGRGHAVAIADGKLHFFGGASNGRQHDAVLRYAPSLRSLEARAKSPHGIPLGTTAVSLGAGRVFLLRPTGVGLVYQPWNDWFDVHSGLPSGVTLLPAPRVLVDDGRGERSCETVFLSSGTQVDTFDPDRGVLARGRSRTVVRVHVDAGWGRRITLRGSGRPLSWTRDSACRWTPGNVWVYETTEVLRAPLRVKALLNGYFWADGGDVAVRPGETVDLWPNFRRQLSVLSLNLHSYQETDQERKLDLIVDRIASEGVDVVCFQECAQNRNSPYVAGAPGIRADNMARRIVDKLAQRGLGFRYTWEWAHYAWNEWEEGVAILSRLPLEEVESRYVSHSQSINDPVGSRRAIYAQVNVPGAGKVNLFSAHLSWQGAGLEHQVRELVRFAREKAPLASATIVCGDFNDSPSGNGYQAMRAAGFTDAYAVARPGGVWDATTSFGTRIDYVFVWGLEVERAKRVFTRDLVSDHYGVLTTVRWPTIRGR